MCGRGEAWAGDSGESRLRAGRFCQGGEGMKAKFVLHAGGCSQESSRIWLSKKPRVMNLSSDSDSESKRADTPRVPQISWPTARLLLGSLSARPWPMDGGDSHLGPRCSPPLAPANVPSKSVHDSTFEGCRGSNSNSGCVAFARSSRKGRTVCAQGQSGAEFTFCASGRSQKSFRISPSQKPLSRACPATETPDIPGLPRVAR